MFDWFGPVMGIVLVDLVLSGDNAVVIGAAAARLPLRQRMMTMIVGGGGAILLRLLFAFAATLLLQLPYLGAIGGIILLGIALRLLFDRDKLSNHAPENVPLTDQPAQADPHIAPSREHIKNILGPIVTILIADATMSLDNVLAIAGLAAGNLLLLVVGLSLSILLLLVGSALVAALIRRLPWLLDMACLIVGWAAANIFLGDDTLVPLFQRFPQTNMITYVLVTLLILATDFYLLSLKHRKSSLISEIEPRTARNRVKTWR